MSRRACAAVLLAASAGLAACVTVLPPAPPVQLYSFGGEAVSAVAPPAGPGAAPAVQAPGLALASVVLPRAAAGDGLLTVTGDDAAYIAGARWVSPAAVLMQEAAERAFAERAGRVRLVRADAGPAASAVLTLQARDFEARYPAAGAPPVVTITLQAAITARGGVLLAARTFRVDQPAQQNRVSAIVPAYDGAVAQVLAQVVAWADAAAPAITTSAAPRSAPSAPG